MALVVHPHRMYMTQDSISVGTVGNTHSPVLMMRLSHDAVATTVAAGGVNVNNRCGKHAAICATTKKDKTVLIIHHYANGVTKPA